MGNNRRVGDELNTTGFSFNQAQNVEREKLTFRFDVEPSSRNGYMVVSIAVPKQTCDRDPRIIQFVGRFEF